MSGTGHRRLSVLDSYTSVENKIRRTMKHLEGLWDEISMHETMRVSRVSIAFEHITNLLDDMVVSEEAMVENVKSVIATGLETIVDLREQLDFEQWQRPDHPENSIALMKSVEEEVQELRSLHTDRMNDQSELMQRVERLHTRLGAEITLDVPVCVGEKLMPKRDYDTMHALALQWESRVNELVSACKRMQENLKTWTTAMGTCSLDQDLMTILETDFASHDTFVGDGVKDSLSAYHSQVSSMYEDWIAEHEFRWTESYNRIVVLWDQCHVPDAKRTFTPTFSPAIHTEKSMIDISAEITRLEALYSARKEIYDLLTVFKKKWLEKLSLEQSRKDPNYYQRRDREHNLMKDTNTARRLDEVHIPKITLRIKETFDVYSREHPTDIFLVEHGVTPVQYVNWVLEEYKLEAEVQRKERARQRNQNVFRTPEAVRRPLARTTASCTKLDPVAKKLRFDSTLSPCFSGSSADLLSIISPTRTNKGGPKHSSPKENRPPSAVRSLKPSMSPAPSVRSMKPSMSPAPSPAMRSFKPSMSPVPRTPLSRRL